MNMSSFERTYKHQSKAKLHSLIQNLRTRTPSALNYYDSSKEGYHFGSNPYKPGSTLKAGLFYDAYHKLCSLKYQIELPFIFRLIRTKLNIPVFVALGTEDTIIEKSFLLEYSREKYRGRLQVSLKQALDSIRKKGTIGKASREVEDDYQSRLKNGIPLSEI